MVSESAKLGEDRMSGPPWHGPSLTAAQPVPRMIRKRLPLKRNRRRLRYDLRLRFWLFGLALPTAVLAGWLTWLFGNPIPWAAAGAFAVALVLALIASSLFEQMTRPLQTLANVVAAMREDDFSFRARGARRGDSLGDLALEINSLANTLQTERGVTRDALTLAERVMAAMSTPVLAFAADGTLRLLNRAAESAFALNAERIWVARQRNLASIRCFSSPTAPSMPTRQLRVSPARFAGLCAAPPSALRVCPMSFSSFLT